MLDSKGAYPSTKQWVANELSDIRERLKKLEEELRQID
jgi:hypothetical protein